MTAKCNMQRTTYHRKPEVVGLSKALEQSEKGIETTRSNSMPVPTWKALFKKNLCSRWRKRKEDYDMQQQLDD